MPNETRLPGAGVGAGVGVGFGVGVGVGLGVGVAGGVCYLHAEACGAAVVVRIGK